MTVIAGASKNIFECFNREIESGTYERKISQGTGKKIRFYNKKIIFDLTDRKVCELTIDEFGYSDHYSGYRAKIINKDSGDIANNAFRFEEFGSEVYGWKSGNRLEWYIKKPSNDQLIAFFEKMYRWALEFV